MVDVRGAPGGAAFTVFRLKPKGASFELVERKNFLWNVLATDAEVGPDGALYVLDWVQGWGLTARGGFIVLPTIRWKRMRPQRP